jgi:hypothetical protein
MRVEGGGARQAVSAVVGLTLGRLVDMTETELRDLLAEYLTMLQRHASAEEFMGALLTTDFETGFEGGYSWRGIDGLRDFLSQRDGFFDEKHTIKEVLALDEPSDGNVRARTRLEFLPAPLGAAVAHERGVHRVLLSPLALRHEGDRWRVAAQIVERFDDLNDNAERLFATPDEGLNR